MISPFFKDAALQEEFNANGYVKLKMYTPEEVGSFKDFYNTLHLKDERQYGFSVSIDELDDAARTKMNRFYKETVFPRFAEYLHDPKFFTGSFMIKEPYPTGTVAAHQDWTFVEDEKKYSSLMCWISLDNSDFSNGAMAFIKGSHLFFDQVRGFPLSSTLGS